MVGSASPVHSTCSTDTLNGIPPFSMGEKPAVWFGPPADEGLARTVEMIARVQKSHIARLSIGQLIITAVSRGESKHYPEFGSGAGVAPLRDDQQEVIDRRRTVAIDITIGTTPAADHTKQIVDADGVVTIEVTEAFGIDAVGHSVQFVL